MSRILFTWELGGGLGHVAPLIPLMRPLRMSGHELIAAVRKSPVAQQLLEQAGARCVGAPCPESQISEPIEPARTFSHVLYNTGFHNQEVLLGLARQWDYHFEEIQPDLVVCEHSPIAMMALRATQIPYAAIGTGFCCPPAVAFRDPFLEWPGDTLSGLRQTEEIVLENANAVLRQAGGPILDRLANLLEDVEMQLLLTYVETDHFPERKQPNYLGIIIPHLALR